MPAKVLIETATQGSDEWLAARQAGIGGSEIGTLCGANPYETPYQLWLRKTGRSQPEPASAAMEWGHRLEPVVAAAYAQAHPEATLEVPPALLQHPDVPVALVSLDRLAHFPGETVAVEIKTTRQTWPVLPDRVTCQVQWQLAVTGLERATVAVLANGWDYRETTIDADPVWAGATLERVARWWHDHVVMDTPPDPTAQDDLARYWQPEPGQAVEIGPDLAAEYDTAERVAKEAATRLEQVKARIELVMGPAVTGTVDGVPAFGWPSRKGPTRVDVRALAAEHPEIAALFTVTGADTRQFRRLRGKQA